MLANCSAVKENLSRLARHPRNIATGIHAYADYFKTIGFQKSSRENQRRMREIQSGLRLPTSLPKLPRGAIAAITMVKNEEDIINDTVSHLLSQGVDYVLIADNGSTDSTPEILKDLARSQQVDIAFDGVAAYYQSEKMGNLARVVRSIGAEWIIPFDADEFWFAESVSVSEFLRSGNGQRFPAKVHNAFPGPNSSVKLWVDTAHEVLPKTAFRSYPFAYPTMGNHFAMRPGDFQEGLHIVHYPWRSREQLQRKSATGSLALKLAKASAEIGSQWTGIDHQNEKVVDEIWESVLNRNPNPILGLRASGPFKLVNPRDLKSWQLS